MKILRTPPGGLNPAVLDTTSDAETIDFNAESAFSVLQRSITKTFDQNRLANLGVVTGILLRIESSTSNATDASREVNGMGDVRLPKYRIKVPLFHAALPNPSSLSNPTNLDNHYIDMYTLFEAENTAVSRQPIQPGGLVNVDWKSKKYLGPVDDSRARVSAWDSAYTALDALAPCDSGLQAGAPPGASQNSDTVNFGVSHVGAPPLPVRTSGEGHGVQDVVRGPNGKDWLERTLQDPDLPPAKRYFDVFQGNGPEDNVDMKEGPGRQTAIIMPTWVDPTQPYELIYFFHGKLGFTGPGLRALTRAFRQMGGNDNTPPRNFIFVWPECLWSKENIPRANARTGIPRQKSGPTNGGLYGRTSHWTDRQWGMWGYNPGYGGRPRNAIWPPEGKRPVGYKDPQYPDPESEKSGGNFAQLHQEVLATLRREFGASNNPSVVTLMGHSAGGAAIGNIARTGQINEVPVTRIVFSDSSYAGTRYNGYLDSDLIDVYRLYVKDRPQVSLEIHSCYKKTPSNSGAITPPPQSATAFIGAIARARETNTDVLTVIDGLVRYKDISDPVTKAEAIEESPHKSGLMQVRNKGYAKIRAWNSAVDGITVGGQTINNWGSPWDDLSGGPLQKRLEAPYDNIVFFTHGELDHKKLGSEVLSMYPYDIDPSTGMRAGVEEISVLTPEAEDVESKEALISGPGINPTSADSLLESQLPALSHVTSPDNCRFAGIDPSMIAFRQQLNRGEGRSTSTARQGVREGVNYRADVTWRSGDRWGQSLSEGDVPEKYRTRLPKNEDGSINVQPYYDHITKQMANVVSEAKINLAGNYETYKPILKGENNILFAGQIYSDANFKVIRYDGTMTGFEDRSFSSYEETDPGNPVPSRKQFWSPENPFSKRAGETVSALYKARQGVSYFGGRQEYWRNQMAIDKFIIHDSGVSSRQGEWTGICRAFRNSGYITHFVIDQFGQIWQTCDAAISTQTVTSNGSTNSPESVKPDLRGISIEYLYPSWESKRAARRARSGNKIPGQIPRSERSYVQRKHNGPPNAWDTPMYYFAGTPAMYEATRRLLLFLISNVGVNMTETYWGVDGRAMKSDLEKATVFSHYQLQDDRQDGFRFILYAMANNWGTIVTGHSAVPGLVLPNPQIDRTIEY